MAMTKCRECGREVSSKAAACPGCGNPMKTKSSGTVGTGTGCLVIIVAGVLIIAALGGMPSGSVNSTRPPPVSDADCRKDLSCWAERHYVDALIACKKAIQAQAKWQHEWTAGTLEREFDRYGWANAEKSAVTYFGDKLKMQNGFGAWKNMQYGCTFDPAARRVIAAVVE